ncbi:inositol monophosphatase family protein [Desulfurispira natronophila]|uniref:Inositol-1-monophosphatase n=1 Tax=Desulfurispira natronophila TaxID=682562 RepID=A0A7W7Y2R3_9BACT|nr:inositol monophosphatase family protein [Desulfurispira natronophila]MBB5021011.1 myo-inositol-1(or 4)-monophosphatase [Desulfurispira natronophila]
MQDNLGIQTIDLIWQAGHIIRQYTGANKDIRHKSERDLVTAADLAVEQFLVEHLSALYPEYTLVAEESAVISNNAIPQRALYIDPIDGTTNFAHDFPFVAISVGAYRDGKGEWGIVYNPYSDELYSASSGEGAFLNGNHISVSNTDKLSNSLIGTGFPYDVIRSQRRQQVLSTMDAVMQQTRGIRRCGSAALDLCYVARGVFEGFYEWGLKPWDIAAGAIIVQEAGGSVSDMFYHAHNLYTDGILASNGILHQDLISLMQE